VNRNNAAPSSWLKTIGIMVLAFIVIVVEAVVFVVFVVDAVCGFG